MFMLGFKGPNPLTGRLRRRSYCGLYFSSVHELNAFSRPLGSAYCTTLPVGIVLRILLSYRSFSLLHHANLSAEPPAPMLGYDMPPHQPSDSEVALLALTDPSLDSRISLIGPNTLEMLCALLRRGSTDVSASRICDRPQAGTADVAVIARVTSPDCLTRAIAHARRVLAPLGTVAIHLPVSPADALSQQAGHLLLLHGFGLIRLYDYAGETLIRAELPLHGRLACA